MIVLIAIGAYFFTYPQWTNLGENKLILEQAQEENTTLKKQEMEITNFLNSYRSQKSQTDFAGKILPLKRPELESVLSNLESFASASGVSLASAGFTDQGVNQLTANKLSDYQITYVEMSLAASGSYPSYRAFLSQLENNLRLMDVININIINNDDSTKLEYKLIARVYYQK